MRVNQRNQEETSAQAAGAAYTEDLQQPEKRAEKTRVATAEHTEEGDWKGGGLVMQSLAVPVRA